MENKLENLKESMDKTVLKDGTLSSTQKQKIYYAAVNHRKTNKRNYITPFFSFVFLSCLIIFMGSFVYKHMKDAEHQKLGEGSSIRNKQASQSTLNGNGKVNKSTSIYIPEKQKEYYGVMSKEEILTKMLNTIKYFDTAKGSFVEHIVMDNGQDTGIDSYELSVKKDGGFDKYVQLGSKIGTSAYYYKRTQWTLLINKTYRSAPYQPIKFPIKTLKIKDAFTTDSHGAPVTFESCKTGCGIGSFDTLFPYDLASTYTRDLNSWKIEKQRNETLLGHNTIVLKGTLKPSEQKNYHSKTFRFWVDKVYRYTRKV